MFKQIANTAAVLSLASSIIDAGKKAMKDASNCAQTAVAIKDIKDISGDSLLNAPSEKYNTMKSFVRNADLTTGSYKVAGAVYGFVTGFAKITKNNLASISFSILTLASKNKVMKTIGVAGTGLSMAWDFIKNGTNLFTKKNSIEK